MAEINITKILAAVVGTLDKLGIPYYVTGGVAVSFWGSLRFTADIDMVVKMAVKDVGPLSRELSKIAPRRPDNCKIDVV